ncbi:MAG TPA: GAF domain-containing protein, partial [Burkholderiaceae bacterium]|nr:GAF domain-containing protein [Burkholderiaceae bacterium]
LGFVYADLEGAFGRFSDADRDLLALLAGQAGVALANLRFAAGLEDQVAARTTEARTAQAQAEQRAGELAVINDIQQGVAARLDFQGIVDLVGDRLCEVFASRDLFIRLLGADGLTLHGVYSIEHGKRLAGYSFAPHEESAWFRPMRAGRTLVCRHAADFAAFEMDEVVEGTDMPLSGLFVPVMIGERFIGLIGVENHEREDAFDESAVRLVQTVATSMGTALDNARLFAETQASLQRQTASAEILRAIGQSPGDEAPVIDAIVGAAQRLLGCFRTAVLRREGNHLISLRSATEGGLGPSIAPRLPLDPAHNLPSRVVLSRERLHIPDWSAVESLPHERFVREQTGGQAALLLPLLRGGDCLGVLAFQRDRVGAFSAQDIALAESFADQAVIAIENVRLFNETQEALARQTATAEVLQVISESPTDVQPVFDVIAERAATLTGARFALLVRLEGDWLQLASLHGADPQTLDAARGAWPQRLADSTTVSARAIREGRVVNIADALDMPGTDYDPEMRQVVARAGWRGILAVPLVRERQVIGALSVGLDRAGLLADKEVALLKTFARQAVVAIENVRLFNETREALAQQTAAAEVLNVISNSVADADPAFKAIAGACQVLFGSDQVVLSLVDDAGMVRHERSDWPALVPAAEAERQWAALNAAFPRPLAQSYQAYPLRKRRVVQYPDMVHGPGVPEAMRQNAREVGNFSMLIAPMQTETRDLGTIHIVRAPPRPFSDKEAALLKSYADQAVIAIQNARLFNETQEALEQQRASAEVLSVISSSVADTAPVFDQILQSCERLFPALFFNLHLVNEAGLLDVERIHATAAALAQYGRQALDAGGAII